MSTPEADHAIAEAARAWVKDMGECHFCDYGADDGHGCDKGHDDECPIELYDNDGARVPPAPARLDADKTAKPLTEIVAVMPPHVETDDHRTVHVGQATHYVVRPTAHMITCPRCDASFKDERR